MALLKGNIFLVPITSFCPSKWLLNSLVCCVSMCIYVYDGEVWCIFNFLKKSGNHDRDNLSHQRLANIHIPIVYKQCESTGVVKTQGCVQMNRSSLEEEKGWQLKAWWWVHLFITQADMTLYIILFLKKQTLLVVIGILPRFHNSQFCLRHSVYHSFPQFVLMILSGSSTTTQAYISVISGPQSWNQSSPEGLSVGSGRPS